MKRAARTLFRLGFLLAAAPGLASVASAPPPPPPPPIENVSFSERSSGLAACIMREFYAATGYPPYDSPPGMTWRISQRVPGALESMFCGMRSASDSLDCIEVYILALGDDGWRLENGTVAADRIAPTVSLAIPAIHRRLGDLSIEACVDQLHSSGD